MQVWASLFLGIGLLFAPAAAMAQSLDEPGEFLEVTRPIAQELLPIEPLTLDDGFLMMLATAEVRLLPLVDQAAAQEAGLRAEGVRLTHRQLFQSLDGLTFVDVRVSFVEATGVAEAYIDARSAKERAHPAPAVGFPALMVKPDDVDNGGFGRSSRRRATSWCPPSPRSGTVPRWTCRRSSRTCSDWPAVSSDWRDRATGIAWTRSLPAPSRTSGLTSAQRPRGC